MFEYCIRLVLLWLGMTWSLRKVLKLIELEMASYQEEETEQNR